MQELWRGIDDFYPAGQAGGPLTYLDWRGGGEELKADSGGNKDFRVEVRKTSMHPINTK